MVAAAAGEMVASVAAEGSEDSRLSLHPFLFKIQKLYSSFRRAINLGAGDKAWAKGNPIAREGG